MGKNYVETLACQKSAGTLFNTYTTAKSVINPDCIPDLPRSVFWVPGRRAHIIGEGAISNVVTAAPTIQFLVKLGTIASAVTVFDSGQVQLNTIAHTTLPFSFEIRLRSDKDNYGNGTTAKLWGRMTVKGIMFAKSTAQIDSLQSDNEILLPQTAPVLGAGFDATIVTNPDFWAGFSASNAGNGIRIDDYAFIDMGIA